MSSESSALLHEGRWRRLPNLGADSPGIHSDAVARELGFRTGPVLGDTVRCQDDVDGCESWIAIAVHDDKEWQALLDVSSELTLADPRFTHGESRKIHEDDLDACMSAWVRQYSVEDLLQVLLTAGVPCAPVRDDTALLGDEQLRHRGHYEWPPHAGVRSPPLGRLGFRIEDMDHGPRRSAPHLGEHTAEVLGEVLGLSAAELSEQADRGAFGGAVK